MGFGGVDDDYADMRIARSYYIFVSSFFFCGRIVDSRLKEKKRGKEQFGIPSQVRRKKN